jgi:hypothetical protein
MPGLRLKQGHPSDERRCHYERYRYMTTGRYIGFVLAGLLAAGASTSAATRDGAIIRNSGSTNSAPYSILVWSDGAARWMAGDQQKDFTIDPGLAKRFIEDAQAMRRNPGTPVGCMKSVSFGTSTSVTYHGWTSNDLECPAQSSAAQALSQDARSIVGAAGVMPARRRIPLPIEPHRTEPTMQPPSSSPSSKPSARIGGRSLEAFKSDES